LSERIDQPNELAPFLDTNALTWQRILGVDASALAVFGRISALSVNWIGLHREALAELGLNYAELSVLGMLRTALPGRRRSPTQLRRLIGQSSAGMTRILDKLEGEGHLRREDIDGDRRRVDIVLTESGAELAERAVGALLALESSVVALVAPERRAAVVTALDALLGAFAARRKG
jgi:DNA-binding MarR family transcriptional regulator